MIILLYNYVRYYYFFILTIKNNYFVINDYIYLF